MSPQSTAERVLYFFGRRLVRCFYRVTPLGLENLPVGGFLLVPNHISWIDGVLLMLTSSRPIRMIAWAPNIESRPWIKRLAQLFGAIPIDPLKPKKIVELVKTERAALTITTASEWEHISAQWTL